jgi:hypothetical protein
MVPTWQRRERVCLNNLSGPRLGMVALDVTIKWRHMIITFPILYVDLVVYCND